MKTQTAPCSSSFAEEREEAKWQDFACCLTIASRDLELRGAYTPEHCAKLERLFLQMQAQIQRHILRLEQPEYRREQDLLLRLRLLHRDMIGSLVIVRNVCGLCMKKRHISEPTGSYWQLVECVCLLRRECQLFARTHPNQSRTAVAAFQKASA